MFLQLISLYILNLNVVYNTIVLFLLPLFKVDKSKIIFAFFGIIFIRIIVRFLDKWSILNFGYIWLIYWFKILIFTCYLFCTYSLYLFGYLLWRCYFLLWCYISFDPLEKSKRILSPGTTHNNYKFKII